MVSDPVSLCADFEELVDLDVVGNWSDEVQIRAEVVSGWVIIGLLLQVVVLDDVHQSILLGLFKVVVSRVVGVLVGVPGVEVYILKLLQLLGLLRELELEVGLVGVDRLADYLVVLQNYVLVEDGIGVLVLNAFQVGLDDVFAMV